MKPSELFEGENSSLRKTFDSIASSPQPEEWSIRFEALFGYGSKEDIKSFLKTEIRKVEERKNDNIQKVIDKYKVGNSLTRSQKINEIIKSLEALKK
jgi:hypothetical protein